MAHQPISFITQHYEKPPARTGAWRRVLPRQFCSRIPTMVVACPVNSQLIHKLNNSVIWGGEIAGVYEVYLTGFNIPKISIRFNMPKISKKVFVGFFIACFCLAVSPVFAEDTCYIKVQFIYGSKPLKKYRDTEKKWFGGLPGGHVGIETDSSRIIDFHPYKNFHLFTTNNNKHSRFLLRPANEFWSCFGCPAEVKKTATVIIPVTREQKQRFDSIANSYLSNTPYDYAFLGMRCAAAAYDLLSHIGVVERYPLKTMYMKIFYPKKLRARLIAKAEENGWAVVKQEGSPKRKWEQD